MTNTYAKQLMEKINEGKGKRTPEVDKIFDIIEGELNRFTGALRHAKNDAQKQALEMTISELGVLRQKFGDLF